MTRAATPPTHTSAPARTAPRDRRRRLQILLLAVLALWLVDRELAGSARASGGETQTAASVSSGPPPFGAGTGRSVAGSEDAPSERELASLLARVNPALDRREVHRIAAAVLRSSAKYRLDPELVTAILMVESRARPWARSPKGAVGLMQVMPHMMEPLQLAGNPATIESNLEAGCFILASDIRRLGEADGISTYFWGLDIRGGTYLQKVRAAQAEVRRHRASGDRARSGGRDARSALPAMAPRGHGAAESLAFGRRTGSG